MTALGLAALIAAVCFLQPGHTPWLPPCLFHKLTGLYCPGCGSTRMLYYLLHGHPILAVQQNALAMVILPGAIYGLVRQLVPSDRFALPRIPPEWGTSFFAVVLLFTIGRNIPVVPFRWLAPGGVSSLFLDGHWR